MPSIDFEAMNEGILGTTSKSYFNSFMKTFDEQLSNYIATNHITTLKTTGKFGDLLFDYAKQNKRTICIRKLECLQTQDGQPISCVFMYSENAVWLVALGDYKEGNKSIDLIIYRLEETVKNNRRTLKLNKVDSVKREVRNESTNLLDW